MALARKVVKRPKMYQYKKILTRWRRALPKYGQVFKISWQEQLVYRLNFVMWRVRNLTALITLYFFWLAVFRERAEILGYSQSLILTYIITAAVLRAIIFSSRTIDVAEEIVRGDLSLYLLRPISYFKYWFTRDVADKVLNIGFTLAEISLIILIFKPPLFFQTSPAFLLAFLAAIALAVILYFFISFLLGLIGFWSPEGWAPRFLFIVSIEFFAGGLFPLDVLPTGLFRLFQVLPFGYLLYFPANIYLGRLSLGQMFVGFATAGFWILVFAYAVYGVWQKGLKIYAAEGR